MAGAGTGKTTVITRRIAWLIAEKRARPSEILALTFTDRAAFEMIERVDRLVPYGHNDAQISTFHAFGDRLLRDHALEAGLSDHSTVLSRAEQVIFLREHLFDLPLDRYRPLGDPTRFLSALVTLISRLRDEDVTPDAYLAAAGRLADAAAAAPDDEALAERAAAQAELAATYAAYESLMRTSDRIDFGDQVSLALRLLREHPAVLDEVRRRYRYICVDEFQDTNHAQWELVRLIAEPHRNVTVVGDDDQSIYRFRGAALGNILGFRDAYPKAASVVLVDNFRSRQAILDGARRLIRHNDPDRLEAREGIDKRLQGAGSIRTPRGRARCDRPDRSHHRIRRGRCGRRPHRRLHPLRASGGRARHPRAGQSRRRSVPARAEHGAHLVALQRHRRALPPAGGAGAHQLPARGQRSRTTRSACTTWRPARSSGSRRPT